MSRFLRFGFIARPHGVRGELRLQTFQVGDTFPAGVESVELTPRGGGDGVVYELVGRRPSNDAWLLRLRGVDGREAAEALKGCQVAIERSAFEPLDDGEFYLQDLQGARVLDQNGQPLGTVAAIYDNRGQDLLALATPAGEQLIPLVDETIVSFIDGVLTIDLVDDLLELGESSR